MKKLALLACAGLFASGSVFAADALNNTQWKTIDDATGKPKAIVQFNEQGGTLSAKIVKVLDPKAGAVCNLCKGRFKDKSLVGQTIVTGLKPVGGGQYEGGKISDPQSGKDYKMKATLNGNKLTVRGFIGISLVGRNQTWVRAN